MKIWEADFYRRPLQDQQGRSVWELLLCDPVGAFKFSALCPQAEASANWLAEQLQKAAEADNHLPEQIRAFRPQSLNLLETACHTLNIELQPTRRTPALKQWLETRYRNPEDILRQHPELQPTQSADSALEPEKPAPLPMPENLWGEQWRFASLAAGDLEMVFRDRPMPVVDMPSELLPLSLGLPSTVAVPGVVIDGGRRSLQLARWLQSAGPVALNYISGAPDGLILEAGLVDRWIVATFEDPEVQAAARAYEQRKQMAQGLHFLLVQPDDSGMTYTGFWLLQTT